jgi:hypothetical protein
MSDDSSLDRASSKLAYDVLGPTAKYLGKGLLSVTEASVENLKRVFQNAKKRQAELGVEGGAIPSRILPTLIRSAAVCEDQVVASYLGGVLCSSRTEAMHDDRAVSLLHLIDGLSGYAIRVHCIVYASAFRQAEHKTSDIKNWLLRQNGITVQFDETVLRERMHFQNGENPELLLEHAFVNLEANGLSEGGHRPILLHKTKEHIRYVHLTVRGVELFCWGTGLGQLGIDAYFEPEHPNMEVEGAVIPTRKVDLGIVKYG